MLHNYYILIPHFVNITIAEMLKIFNIRKNKDDVKFLQKMYN